jgi:hemolysin activation/secretion protein
LLQAYAALRGQLAWNNLDTTEQFRAGGPDGVRAFPAGEGSGDQGAVLTLELRLLPPAEFTQPLGGQAMFSLFMDRAVVQPRRRAADATTARLDPRQDYGGWGLGLTLNHPAGWDLRSSLATPTINQPKDADDRPGVRFSMYMGKQF